MLKYQQVLLVSVLLGFATVANAMDDNLKFISDAVTVGGVTVSDINCAVINLDKRTISVHLEIRRSNGVQSTEQFCTLLPDQVCSNLVLTDPAVVDTKYCVAEIANASVKHVRVSAFVIDGNFHTSLLVPIECTNCSPQPRQR